MRYALLALVCLAPSRAMALDPELGARGQVVFTDNLHASASWRGYDASGAQFASAVFAPSVDYFVARNVSIGIDANIAWADSHSYDATSRFVRDTTTSAQIGLRVGANVRLGRWLSLWPRATVYFDWVTYASGDDFFETQTSTFGNVRLTLFVPLVMHLRSHVFVGVGPLYGHEFVLALDPKGPATEVNDVSLGTMLGGYIGGEAVATRDEPRVEWRAFGSEHQLAFDGSASAFWNGSSNGSSALIGASASIGVDWFYANRFSIGVGVTPSYSRYESGGSYQESWAFALGPRVGVDVPISRFFSFFPRASLGLGAASYDIRAGGARNSAVSLIVSVAAYAPILLHVAPHFFIDCGPSIYRELADINPSYASPANNATAVGLSLGVGGWL